MCFQVGGLCWGEGSADSENAYDETKECMWRVSGNRKIVRSDDPWQLGLQQAVAMWAERTDPGIRGSSSDATATLFALQHSDLAVARTSIHLSS